MLLQWISSTTLNATPLQLEQFLTDCLKMVTIKQNHRGILVFLVILSYAFNKTYQDKKSIVEIEGYTTEQSVHRIQTFRFLGVKNYRTLVVLD